MIFITSGAGHSGLRPGGGLDLWNSCALSITGLLFWLFQRYLLLPRGIPENHA